MELVTTCDDSCVEANPGFKSGYRVNFLGTAGRLTPKQIAETLVSGARIYHVEPQRPSRCVKRSEEPTPAGISLQE